MNFYETDLKNFLNLNFIENYESKNYKNTKNCKSVSTLPPTAPWAFCWENDLNSHD